MKQIPFLIYTLVCFSCANNAITLKDTTSTTTWKLSHINSKSIHIENEKQRPQFTLNSLENKIHGKGVCNRFFGDITALTNTKLTFKDNFGSTRMMCKNIEIEFTFFKTLAKSDTYKIQQNILYIYDAANNEILRFNQ